jgi:acyl-CoA thioester hydrolase
LSTPARFHQKAFVKEQWIDLYGHMNMAHYVAVLDELGHQILERFGMGESYTNAQNCGLFTVDARVRYLKELRAGDPLRVELTPLRFDEKRLITKVDLYHDEAGYLSATMEQTAVNVDLATRRASNFSPQALAMLQKMMDTLGQ